MKLFLVFILFNLSCFGQEGYFKGLVFYTQTESMGRGKFNGPQRPSTLVFEKTISTYTTQKDSLDNLLTDRDVQSVFLNENADGGSIMLSPIRSSEGTQVVTDLVKDSVWSSFKIDKKYYVKESREKIDWHFEKATKKIGNFECKSAKCKFRGRVYTAWYTLDLPVQFGPWKLQGLPGLILEAYDDKQEIFFSFKGIEYPKKNPIKIEKINRNISDVDRNDSWMTVKESLLMIEGLLVKWYEAILVNMPNQPVKKIQIENYNKEISE